VSIYSKLKKIRAFLHKKKTSNLERRTLLMKGRPLIPFAIIALLGVVLMVALSAVGNHMRNVAEEGGEGAQEEVVIDDPIEYGETVVSQSCIACHANDLSGTGNAPAINNLEGRLSHEEIVEIVTNGLDGGMPAFGGQLQENEIEAVAEYLLDASQ
jgi:cytochrome c550